MIRAEALDAVSLRSSLRDGRTSAEAVVRASIERIAEMEPRLRAWQTFDPAFALAQARQVDRRMKAGAEPGLLAGVPFAVKDTFDTADLPTGYGSALYHGHRPGSDADAVAIARRAGGVVLGKTVTTEFAYFTPGPTANPWDPGRTPGGSSSGSAAAVAAGMVPLAFGSQTAGSLIRPASYCGVFALKPTYGRFNLAGVKPLSPSMDTLGWLARSADDLELMRCALAAQPYVPLQRRDPRSLRVGICRTHEWPALDQGGVQVWNTALDRLAKVQVRLPSIEMPEYLSGLMDAQKDIMAWEAARSLEVPFREHGERLSKAIVDLIRRGTDISPARFEEAQALAATGRRQVAQLMSDCDVLLVPAAPGEAPEGLAATGDPVFSRVWTLLGFPCVNVPGMSGPHGMPVGLQLVGRRDRERDLLEVAASIHAVLA